MKRILEKKKVYSFCARKEIVEEFQKNCMKKNQSMSERIENFMKKENDKGTK